MNDVLRYLRKDSCLDTIAGYLKTQRQTSVQQFIRGYITSSVGRQSETDRMPNVTKPEIVSRCRKMNGTLSVSLGRPRSGPLHLIRMAGGASP
jgi:hypothetical protein